jgi:hypothetical protein
MKAFPSLAALKDLNINMRLEKSNVMGIDVRLKDDIVSVSAINITTGTSLKVKAHASYYF